MNDLIRRPTCVKQVVMASLSILLMVAILAGCGAGSGSGQAASAPAAQSTHRATATPHVTSKSGLPIIRYQDLPTQARDTIRLIDQGGPFPFSRDGITFQNREQLLPRKASGYYREYTVVTPGSSDRGARRIVAGEDGELYYTDDHYESFREVMR